MDKTEVIVDRVAPAEDFLDWCAKNELQIVIYRTDVKTYCATLTKLYTKMIGDNYIQFSGSGPTKDWAINKLMQKCSFAIYYRCEKKPANFLKKLLGFKYDYEYICEWRFPEFNDNLAKLNG